MTPEKSLKIIEVPKIEEQNVSYYVCNVNVTGKYSNTEQLGLINPLDLEKSSEKGINEVMSDRFDKSFPQIYKQNVFLPSAELLTIFVRAIAHYGHNREGKLMKRFGFAVTCKNIKE